MIDMEKKPLTIVDVGAKGGIHKKWEKIDYCAILFEPNPKEEFQQRENWLVIRNALSDTAGEKNLYIARKNSNSSLHEPNFDLLNGFSNPKRYEIVETLKIQTDTLDNQLRVHNIDDVDYLKVDVQGHELAVLKGGIASLKKAVAIEIEVEFSPIYKNVPLFAHVDSFLKEQGFELAAFPHLETWKHGRRESLIWGDALYLKNPEILSDVKRERFNILKKILLPEPKFPIITVKSIKTMLVRIKRLLKKALVGAGFLHPSLGVKISAEAKAALILQYKASRLNTFVETGTNEGGMIDRVGSRFQKIYSIELDDFLYNKAQERFQAAKNVRLLHGDSAYEIKKILAELHEPALFWLDAHGSGTITSENTPILKELEAIFNHTTQGHVILIDDARHFTRRTISKMKKLTKIRGYIFSIKDGVFTICPAEQQ